MEKRKGPFTDIARTFSGVDRPCNDLSTNVERFLRHRSKINDVMDLSSTCIRHRTTVDVVMSFTVLNRSSTNVDGTSDDLDRTSDEVDRSFTDTVRIFNLENRAS